MGESVRVGYGLSIVTSSEPERFAALVDNLERTGFDSLWLPERAAAPSPDPLVALSFAAGRTKRLKLGTAVQVLPGRNPVLLARSWASLDALSGGRALPAFGLGAVHGPEQQAFGVPREQRAAYFDEAIRVMRGLWDGEEVTHDGHRFHLDNFRLTVRPARRIDAWFGGKARSELRRIGRLGDGWLASFETPASYAAGRKIIEETADSAGRVIDPGHYGTTLPYGHGEATDAALAYARLRNPDVDPLDLVATSIDAIPERIERFVEAGVSKFVLVPMVEPGDWAAELDEVAAAVGSLPLT